MAGDLFQLLVRWYQWAVTFPDQTRRASGQTRRNRAVTLLSERRRAGTGTDAVPDQAGHTATDGGGEAVSLRPDTVPRGCAAAADGRHAASRRAPGRLRL